MASTRIHFEAEAAFWFFRRYAFWDASGAVAKSRIDRRFVALILNRDRFRSCAAQNQYLALDFVLPGLKD
jgi:hypothetical protein